MTDLPHVIAGRPVTEEHFRIFEAWLREHDMPVAGARPTDVTMNQAIDWWNGLRPEAEAEELAEAVAQAWHYPDTGEGES